HWPCGTRVGFAQWTINIACALEPRCQVTVIEREPVILIESRYNGGHTLMPGTANIKRKAALRLTSLQQVVHRSGHYHRSVKCEDIQRLFCRLSFRSSVVYSHAASVDLH